MSEQIRKKIREIQDEVRELHPLLRELFEKHSGITHVEYTHGSNEMGADLVLVRTHEILKSTEYIGVIAKVGKIHQDYADIEKQIAECRVPRTIGGGKNEIILSEVWVVCTDRITAGAQRRINTAFSGTKIHFVDGGHLANMVVSYLPDYGLDVELSLSTHLGDVNTHVLELDRQADLIRIDSEPIHIEQNIVKLDINPYQQNRSMKRRPEIVDILSEVQENQLSLIEAGMGGGKSKLIRRMVRHFSDVRNYSEVEVFPILTTFKEYVDDMEGDLSNLIKRKVPDHIEGKLSQKAKVLFFIDALDEKSLETETLIEILSGLLNTLQENPKWHVVLTSRHIGSVEFDKRFFGGLHRYEIRPLSLGQVVKFLEKVCERLNLRSRIIEDLSQSSLFEKLPKTPIAAILLGELLKDSQQDLPSTITELYQKYLELALGRWDIDKGLQSQQEFETVENLLMNLAVYLLDHDLEKISVEEVRNRFQSYLKERNLKVDLEELVKRTLGRSDILIPSRDGHTLSFKHRSFAEFLYAKKGIRNGDLEFNERAFDYYWMNSYFFALGLLKDAPDQLKSLVGQEPETEGQRWMKVINMPNFFLAAYSTPYKIIEDGIFKMAEEAAQLYLDIVEGRIASRMAEIPKMSLLYLLQLVVRDNYAYDFLAPALEQAALRLIDENDNIASRVYSIFLLSVASLDCGDRQSFDFLVEKDTVQLPLDVSFALYHEGGKEETKSKAIKKHRKRIRENLQKNKIFRNAVDQMCDTPIKRLL